MDSSRDRGTQQHRSSGRPQHGWAASPGSFRRPLEVWLEISELWCRGVTGLTSHTPPPVGARPPATPRRGAGASCGARDDARVRGARQHARTAPPCPRVPCRDGGGCVSRCILPTATPPRGASACQHTASSSESVQTGGRSPGRIGAPLPTLANVPRRPGERTLGTSDAVPTLAPPPRLRRQAGQ